MPSITKGELYFTFHNVSINTDSEIEGIFDIDTLHSTMFLLIPALTTKLYYVQITLHSTMFLLIRKQD